MSAPYIIALDSGTTSCRAILFDAQQNIVGMSQREFSQHYPKPGWVEHDPMEIYSCQYGVMTELLARTGIEPEEIAGIGITNQRETTIVWDRATGRPIANGIVWQCRRTASMVEELTKVIPKEVIRQKTGLLPDAYYSATKLRWILDHVEGAQQRAETGELCFGTVESWLIFKLTGGKVHITDATNAARTMLYNIRTLAWDEDILAALNIPHAILPAVRSCSEVYGTVNLGGVEVPIAGSAGDQQAALFGQTCFAPGDVKNTYGTGCFMLMNTGGTITDSQNGLVSTIGIQLGDQVEYALEGSVFIGGAVIQWLRDELGLLPENELTRAASVPIDGHTNGAVVYENRETMVPGVFACGNVLQVHDLVDYVTAESELAGTAAAHYVLSGCPEEACDVLNVAAGENVSYTVPQKIRPGRVEKTVEIFFRVRRPLGESRIVVTSGGQQLAVFRRTQMAPGEMERIALPKALLQKAQEGITVTAEEVRS